MEPLKGSMKHLTEPFKDLEPFLLRVRTDLHPFSFFKPWGYLFSIDLNE